MVRNKQEKNYTAANAQGQAKNTYAGVKLVLPQVAPGYFDVAFYHHILNILLFVTPLRGAGQSPRNTFGPIALCIFTSLSV